MNSKQLGELIKQQRKFIGLTQSQVALACGVGIRFISDLENGKPTCHIGKALLVIESIGFNITLNAK